jgi:hypothetical protein
MTYPRTMIFMTINIDLISTGKLDAGTSVLMIDHIEKDGKIEKSGDYNVYKIGNLPATREGERNML